MARRLTQAEKDRRARERKQKQAVDRFGRRLRPHLKVSTKGATFGTRDVKITITRKGVKVSAFGLEYDRAFKNDISKAGRKALRRHLASSLKHSARAHVDSIIDRVLRQHDRAKPIAAPASRGTFIQRSRNISSAEKAMIHDQLGAGRSRVIRHFLGFTKEDETDLKDALEKAIEARLRSL